MSAANNNAVSCGTILILPFVVGLMLWLGWTYGITQAIEEVKPLSYWVCVALVCMVMGVGACLRLLFRGWAKK